MSSKPSSRPIFKFRRRSPALLLLLLLFWSLIISVGLARAIEPPQRPGAIDPVPPQSQLALGRDLYLEACADCHLAVPPGVLPTQTWKTLLEDSNHYGQQITPLVDPTRLLVWKYLNLYSRPLSADEPVPYRLAESQPFRAIHPRVEFASPVTLNSCATCHPGAKTYNFGTLTPEWQNAE
ncbi:diheme cytochrome C [Oxynema sp. CENA135]|uniref:diheme cytochrome C n=1 Tax=Oxynema sp. CENA135 TaxID=984206 RepID=UPI00190DCB08|nr:diheme cytochrome C [Oxynema sp. CENA135]MBK4731120.1 diheme cytochrome C [Oxynema sp. CENA135]